MPVKVEYRDGDGDRISNFNVTRELYTSSELIKYGISQSSSLLVPGIIVVVLVLGGIYYWRRKKE
jgi:LPXTG-motif cell wall-anchored protein